MLKFGSVFICVHFRNGQPIVLQVEEKVKSVPLAPEIASESEKFVVVNVVVKQRRAVNRQPLETTFGVYETKNTARLLSVDKRTLHQEEKTTKLVAWELSRLLALFGDMAIDHLLLGHVLSAKGGSGYLKITESPHAVGSLTSFLYISKYKSALVINTAKRGTIYNQYINLEHFFLENSFRHRLRDQGVNEVLIYNIDMSNRPRFIDSSLSGFAVRNYAIFYTSKLSRLGDLSHSR